MRCWVPIGLFCLFHLSGCLYYGDLHGEAKPLTGSELSTHRTYPVPTHQLTTGAYWEQFHDPQLNQLIAVALSDSPDMVIAEARVRGAQQLVQAAVAPMWPAIDLSGSLQRQRFSETGLVPPPFNGKIFNIANLGFNFSYEFDFWGKNRQTIAARVSEACAAEADFAESRLVLSAVVASVYFQLLTTIQQKGLAQENWHKSKELADITVARTSKGIESDIPVKTALSNEQESRLSIDRYIAQEQLYRNQLVVLLGNNPFTTRVMTQVFKYRQYQIHIPNYLSSNVLARRPDIAATKQRAEAAAHEINVAKAGFYPSVNLVGLFSYQSIFVNKLFKHGNQNNAITGTFDLPIFDAGLRRANLGGRYAEYDIAVSQYNSTLLNALRDVADQQAKIKSLRAQINSQNDALKANLHNSKLYQLRYKNGIIDYVPVLELQQLVLQQRSVLLDLQMQHLVAIVGMFKALGGYTPTNL